MPIAPVGVAIGAPLFRKCPVSGFCRGCFPLSRGFRWFVLGSRRWLGSGGGCPRGGGGGSGSFGLLVAVAVVVGVVGGGRSASGWGGCLRLLSAPVAVGCSVAWRGGSGSCSAAAVAGGVGLVRLGWGCGPALFFVWAEGLWCDRWDSWRGRWDAQP
jgi:hypothetical protein